MLITCPECQFARNINAGAIPPKAQLATCPRCKTKFRFRILHDEEEVLVESVEEVPATQNAKDDLQASTHREPVESVKKVSGDSVVEDSTMEEEYIESQMVAAMQEEIEQLIRAEEAEQESVEQPVKQSSARGALLEEASVADRQEESHLDDINEVLSTPALDPQDEIVEEKPKTFLKRSASAQALREQGVVSHDVTDMSPEAVAAEEEAVRQYQQVQESQAVGTASAHIVSEQTSDTDIWDAIAAMGDEPECVESFAPGCGSQVNIIPWEDSRLGFVSRAVGTFKGLFVHPIRFWRGINAHPSLLQPMLFSLFMCAVSCIATAVGVQVLVANWMDVSTMLQTGLLHEGYLPVTLLWSDVAPFVMVVLCFGLLLLPAILGLLTSLGARLLGGDPVPFSTGVKAVSYSTGAVSWLLVPVVGVLGAVVYLPFLYVSSVRAGYNLSLFKSVVLVGTVLLLFAASVLIMTAAGVTFM